MLGKRDPEYYGSLTLSDLEARLIMYGQAHNIEIECFQTNSESECLMYLHRIVSEIDCGVIINAGAWTHYNYAIRDALEILSCPKVEVHLSDIARRESFRQLSVIREVVNTHFQGEKEQSYVKAINYIKGVL